MGADHLSRESKAVGQRGSQELERELKTRSQCKCEKPQVRGMKLSLDRKIHHRVRVRWTRNTMGWILRWTKACISN